MWIFPIDLKGEVKASQDLGLKLVVVHIFVIVERSKVGRKISTKCYILS
jgi:hypothetical protein